MRSRNNIGVRFVRADVANEADVKAMVDRTLEWFGRLDCLVNNAGIPSPMISITEIDVATIDQVLAVNVRGVILGIKHAAPVMLAQQSGSIINVGSMAGHSRRRFRPTSIARRREPSAR